MNLTRAEWTRLIASAYGPTTLSSIGFGAIMPLVALSARDLGASVGMAAFVVGLLGIGQLVGDLPAGTLAARWGEKWAIVAACLVDAVALGAAFLARDLVVLCLAVFVCGLSGAVFGLARQTYLTEAIPVRWRARALSSLGGVFRIGFFVGPLAGAWIVDRWSLAAAYAFASLMSLFAAAVTLALPDLPAHEAPVHSPTDPTRLWAVLAHHRRVLLTIGLGATVIMLVRSARNAIIPLWCESIGLSPTVTSLIFALSAGFDILLFFPGGAVMDRFGRFWVAVPSMVVLGLGMAVLPLTHTAWTVGLVGALLGLGNGISSGIVMTLGSDASPAVGRPQFLAGWRLFSDLGNTLGPLLISVVTVVAPLAAACVLFGVLGWAGAAWLSAHVPDSPVREPRVSP